MIYCTSCFEQILSTIWVASALLGFEASAHRGSRLTAAAAGPMGHCRRGLGHNVVTANLRSFRRRPWPRPRPRPWPRPRPRLRLRPRPRQRLQRGRATRAGPSKKSACLTPQKKTIQQKRQFLKSYGQMDVKIEFYAKNYAYRHIFRPIRPQKGPSGSI